MPKKCESCLFYDPARLSSVEFCISPAVHKDFRSKGPYYKTPGPFLGLGVARDICDREGNGIFVHFEPKTPTAGAAFENSVSSPHVSKGLAAGGAR